MMTDTARRVLNEEIAYMRLAPDDTPEAMKKLRTEGNRYQTYRRFVTDWEPVSEPYEYTEETERP